MARAILFAMHSSSRIFNSFPAAQLFLIGDGLLYRVLVYVEVCGNTSNTALSLKGTIQRIRRHPRILYDRAPKRIFGIKSNARQSAYRMPAICQIIGI